MVTFLCRLFVWSVQKKSLFCHSHSEKYSNIDTLSSASCAPDCCNVLCSAGAPHVLSISFSEKNAFSAQLNANVAVWTWHKIKLSSYCSLDRILRPNRPFYSCGVGILAFAGTWGYIIKQEGLYQSKVNSSLVSTYNCKMGYWSFRGCVRDWVGIVSNWTMGLFWRKNYDPAPCASPQ